MTRSQCDGDLARLVAALPDANVAGTAAGPIAGIVDDSRSVVPGSIFVAARGRQTDGHHYIADAVARGAVAIVLERDAVAAAAVPPTVAAIAVDDSRVALARLAAAFHRDPSRDLRVVGVTGTNGKTTTVHLIAAILSAAGVPCGRIGTLGATFDGGMWSLGHTTPPAPRLQALLATMRDRGARAVAMEVSSHALATERVAAIDFAVAVLTNVTRDHLDFHGTFEAYAAAKRRLFDDPGAAVLNVDDPLGRLWTADWLAAGRAPTTYGFADYARIRPSTIELGPDGSSFQVDGIRYHLRLPGRFNVANALAAIGVARLAGVTDLMTVEAIAAFTGVPGRMEHLRGGGIDALVDYAHTPDALDSVLRAARGMTSGRLWLVFGCGGDRDRGKRPEMGRIATELADHVLLTSDNPRGEAPQTIADEILRGCAETANVHVELDRRRAINRAIASAAPGDLVVVAGKGHETYQLVGSTTAHFDDRDEVRAALAARKAPTS